MLTSEQAEFVSGLVADIEAAECKNVSLKYTKATRLPPYLVTAPKLRLGVGSEEKLIDITSIGTRSLSLLASIYSFLIDRMGVRRTRWAPS